VVEVLGQLHPTASSRGLQDRLSGIGNIRSADDGNPYDALPELYGSVEIAHVDAVLGKDRNHSSLFLSACDGDAGLLRQLDARR
jgi:hypothetical protein